MKVRLLAAAVAAIGLVAAVQPVFASQLVYRPINPSFGGDPLNGNWLLSQGSAQADGSDSPGFSIDFPDFGGVPQPDPTAQDLPPVDDPNT